MMREGVVVIIKSGRGDGRGDSDICDMIAVVAAVV